jgi:hypothetical protein
MPFQGARSPGRSPFVTPTAKAGHFGIGFGKISLRGKNGGSAVSHLLEFHDEIAFPISGVRFCDPKRFSHTQSRLTGGPFPVLKGIDSVLLSVAVE